MGRRGRRHALPPCGAPYMYCIMQKYGKSRAYQNLSALFCGLGRCPFSRRLRGCFRAVCNHLIFSVFPICRVSRCKTWHIGVQNTAFWKVKGGLSQICWQPAGCQQQKSCWLCQANQAHLPCSLTGRIGRRVPIRPIWLIGKGMPGFFPSEGLGWV